MLVVNHVHNKTNDHVKTLPLCINDREGEQEKYIG